MMINLNFDANRIVEGDVLEQLAIIPDDFIDLTITSPPYNKRNKTHGWLVTNVKYSHFDDQMPEDRYQDWQIEVLKELKRVTKPGGSVFYNHKIRWDDGLMLHPLAWISRSEWLIKQEIVWDRGIAANMRGWRFWQVDERLYWLYKPKDNYKIGQELTSRHAKLSSIWRIPPARRSNKHPAAFPLEIPSRIIYSVLNEPTNQDDACIVLDPFCGTGTTLVAAKLLGHSYAGIDISPEYVHYARERLVYAEMERQTLNKEIAEHKIKETFRERKLRGNVSWPFGPAPGPTQEADQDITTNPVDTSLLSEELETYI